jgi:hypothetical protein
VPCGGSDQVRIATFSEVVKNERGKTHGQFADEPQPVPNPGHPRDTVRDIPDAVHFLRVAAILPNKAPQCDSLLGKSIAACSKAPSIEGVDHWTAVN